MASVSRRLAPNPLSARVLLSRPRQKVERAARTRLSRTAKRRRWKVFSFRGESGGRRLALPLAVHQDSSHHRVSWVFVVRDRGRYGIDVGSLEKPPGRARQG